MVQEYTWCSVDFSNILYNNNNYKKINNEAISNKL